MTLTRARLRSFLCSRAIVCTHIERPGLMWADRYDSFGSTTAILPEIRPILVWYGYDEEKEDTNTL